MVVHDAARYLVGFSLRPHPSHFDTADFEFTSNVLIKPQLRFRKPLSVWPEIWDQVEIANLNCYLNAINLLYLPDTFGVSEASSKSTCLISIEVGSSEAHLLSDRFGVCPLPSSILSESNQWVRLGYDLVSFGGLFSALYGIDWPTDEKKAVGNPFGLIVDLNDAIRLASSATALMPHHPRFLAAGIWAKVTSPSDPWNVCGTPRE